MIQQFITALMLAQVPVAQAPSDATDVQERLGYNIPENLQLSTSTGEAFEFSDLFADDKPVLLIPAYYRCPMLCGLALKAAAQALNALDWQISQDFHVVTFSFDAQDDGVSARKQQDVVLSKLDAKLTREGWPFLTASQPAIDTMLQSIGMQVERDDRGQIAHPAIAVVLTPDGRISRYLYGLDYGAKNLKLALFEASEGKMGSAFERVLLRCYSYDPARRRYGLFIDKFMRIGGLGILFALGISLGVLWRRERKKSRRSTQ